MSTSNFRSISGPRLESREVMFAILYFPITPKFCLYFDGSKAFPLNHDLKAKNFHLAARLQYGKNPIKEPKDTCKMID